MKKRKIYTVGGNTQYTNWMEGSGTWNMRNADLVVFTGGADINPKIYDCSPHPQTWWHPLRDEFELKEFNKAIKLKKKMIGICRGAQLLCAMAGGILVQDSAHPHVHRVTTDDGKSLWVTSSHHQRQYPFPYKDRKANHELIAWSEKLSPYNEGQGYKEKLVGHPEVEIARYPDIQGLAIQSHPEWAIPVKYPWERVFIDYVRGLLNKHLES